MSKLMSNHILVEAVAEWNVLNTILCYVFFCNWNYFILYVALIYYFASECVLHICHVLKLNLQEIGRSVHT